MKRVCTQRKSVIKGIDVSKWQGEIDWDEVSHHVDFAIIRAAYGTTEDRTADGKWGFVENWRDCGETNLVRGVYQYVTNASSGTVQADALCDLIEKAGGLTPDDLPPVLDMEFEPQEAHWPKEDRLLLVFDWCQRIEARLGCVPIIYTYPYYWQEMVTKIPVLYPLWVSHFEAKCPMVPDSWPTWMIWQDSCKGRVDGVKGNVDTNIFEGTKQDLLYLTKMLTATFYDRLRLDELLDKSRKPPNP